MNWPEKLTKAEMSLFVKECHLAGMERCFDSKDILNKWARAFVYEEGTVFYVRKWWGLRWTRGHEVSTRMDGYFGAKMIFGENRWDQEGGHSNKAFLRLVSYMDELIRSTATK